MLRHVRDAHIPRSVHDHRQEPGARLRFDNGMELRCTPSHRLFTKNRGYVEAADLTPDDRVMSLDLPAPATEADWSIPVAEQLESATRANDDDPLYLPDVWTEDFAHYVGWLIGDGTTSGQTTATVYGSADDRTEILPWHQELVEQINGGRPLKVSEQANGTAQLRLSRKSFKRYLESLGVASVTGEHKRIPWSIEQAPPEVVAAFLRGLFDADGCVVNQVAKGTAYVGLGSISIELLRGTQRMLSTFGISSHIYNVRKAGESTFRYSGKDGVERRYQQRASYDLRIAGKSVERFAASVGFMLSRKRDKLSKLVFERPKGFYDVDTTVRLVDRTDEGIELTYNLSEPRNHSYVVNGIVVRNCSEYLSLDNSRCNLASINLLQYLDDDGTFDVGAFTHTVDVVFTAQEILVGRADYPTEKIGATTRAFRQLGMGYANLGAMLMALGLPYDSDEGRAWAAEITSLMTGTAYGTSARMAARVGAFDGYADNAESMLRVLGMHRDASREISEADGVPAELVRPARRRGTPRSTRRGARRAQQPGRGHRTHRHDRAGDGLRHDRHRARPGAGQDEEARRWRHDVDRQPDDPSGAAPARVHPRPGRRHRRLRRRTHVGDRRAASRTRAHCGVRLLDGRQHHPLRGSRADDGRRPTVRQRGDLQDDQHARRRQRRRRRRPASAGWELGLKSVAIYRDNSKVGQPLSTSKVTATPRCGCDRRDGR